MPKGDGVPGVAEREVAAREDNLHAGNERQAIGNWEQRILSEKNFVPGTMLRWCSLAKDQRR